MNITVRKLLQCTLQSGNYCNDHYSQETIAMNILVKKRLNKSKKKKKNIDEVAFFEDNSISDAEIFIDIFNPVSHPNNFFLYVNLNPTSQNHIVRKWIENIYYVSPV